MGDPYDLQRFIDAQDGVYESARAELRAGSKRGHWMWFIFPQLRGLGISPTSQYYGITSLDEASAYLHHPLLGSRIRECVEEILQSASKLSAEQIFGPVDALKLRSSLTLFEQAEPWPPFNAALTGFFGGQRDEHTLALLNSER